MTNKHRKCPHCSRKLLATKLQCFQCKSFFHKKCEPNLELPFSLCSKCLISHLPFNKLENLEFIDHIHPEKPKNCPSFNIQSLIDSMKNCNDDNGFLSDTINSMYYNTDEFTKKAFPGTSFSLLHLNISSLQLHIDELITMLKITNKKFDIICLSETRIKENISSLTNIEIPGYSYFHTPTKTACGGTLIYYRNQLSAKIIKEHSKSVQGVFESTFIEIQGDKKTMIIGNIYRHPRADDSFIDFLEPTLIKLGKTKKKVLISGDFNFDLIKYDTHRPTNEFYDLLSSYSYRPSILQPSRVTSRSNTLIDNIFTNDLSCQLDGGNITYKISDHFSQFVCSDIFAKKNIQTRKQIHKEFQKFQKQRIH